MKILVTGAAGFIGFHTIKQLLNDGYEVVGLDNINDFYSPLLKFARLNELGIPRNDIEWYRPTISRTWNRYRFIRMNLEDKQRLLDLFQTEKFDFVINLAAQAGVRYSIENPDIYIQSNVVGFHYVLEACRTYPVKHLIHASSSSVYGITDKIPFSEEDRTDTPVSLYAATKKSNELTAHAYSHLYKIPITCLRFFTVYCPWGRPDMAPMLFADAVANDRPIQVFNNGNMERDFTYVEDIACGVQKLMFDLPKTDELYRIVNIGNGAPVHLMKFIEQIEIFMGKKARITFLPMQKGDVERTWASPEKLRSITNYRPSTELSKGLEKFVGWYKSSYMHHPKDTSLPADMAT